MSKEGDKRGLKLLVKDIVNSGYIHRVRDEFSTGEKFVNLTNPK